MTKLFYHQERALMFLRFNDSFMLNMEQGTGKTLPTLYRINELFRSGEIKSALVVCPKSVIASWERDLELLPSEWLPYFTDLTIVNYDSVWRGKYNRDFDLIVLDEAHSIANRSSKRSKWLLERATRAKYRYLLTGTPVGNGRLEDLYSLICFLDPYKEGSRVYSKIWKIYTGGRGSYYDWCNRYAYLDQFHKPYKYKLVEEVQRVAREYSYTIKKVDCLDLPDKLPDEIRLLDLGEPKLYKQMAKDSAIPSLDLLADIPLTKLLYLRQIVSGHVKDHKLKTSKIDALKDLLSELGDKKLVIFCEFTASIKAVCETLEGLGISYTTQDGRSQKDAWRRFQIDSEIRVIVCQYQSACQGIDLFAADTICYYEPTLRSNTLEQSRDRIHRTGQKNKCSYIHLITRGTVEEQIYKTLANYKDFSEKLFSEYISDYQRSFRR